MAKEDTLWDGEVPEHIIENLQRGVAPHEKRVVANLAKVSRIVRPDETVRVYDDFVTDWRYDRSEFLPTSNGSCFLCGKKHIREICVIVDDDQPFGASKKEVGVGNECVHKHIEILTDGVEGLTGDAKKDFLKTQMAKAKDRFFKTKFQLEYPQARKYLEGVMENQWLFHKPTITNAKKALKMLNKKGYISRNTLTFRWFEALDLDDEIADTERMVKGAWDAKRLDEAYRRTEYLTIRNQRDFMASHFRKMAERQVDLGWIESSSNISSTENAIRRYGIGKLKWSAKTLYEMVIENDKRGEPIPCLPSEIKAQPSYSDLTEWEQTFVDSTEYQFRAQGGLSHKQLKLLDEMKQKVGLTA